MDRCIVHSTTFGRNNLACACGLAAMTVLEDEGLVENAARMGDYLMDRLRTWPARFPSVGDVRGFGLMIGVEFVRDLGAHAASAGFDFAIAAWLWFTVLFANFAEAVAEGRGKAQAEALRRTKSDTYARRLKDGGGEERVASTELRAELNIARERMQSRLDAAKSIQAEH